MFPGQRTDLAVDSLQQTWEKNYQSTIILFTHLSTHLLIRPLIHLSIHPFIFTHPLIYTSFYRSKSWHNFIEVFGCHIIFVRFSTANWVFLRYGRLLSCRCIRVDQISICMNFTCSNTCDICMFEKKLKETTINKKLIKVLLNNCQGIQIILHI